MSRCEASLTRGISAGYTLAELLTTLAVVAIVASVAAPGLRSFLQNNRAAAQSNEMVAAFSLARSEAMTRGLPVTVCATEDGATCSGNTEWEKGWLVFVDETAPLGEVNGADELLRVFSALEGGSTLAPADDATAAVTYRPDGFLNAAAALTFTLTIPDCSGNQGRSITVSLQGRPAVNATSC